MCVCVCFDPRQWVVQNKGPLSRDPTKVVHENHHQRQAEMFLSYDYLSRSTGRRGGATTTTPLFREVDEYSDDSDVESSATENDEQENSHTTSLFQHHQRQCFSPNPPTLIYPPLQMPLESALGTGTAIDWTALPRNGSNTPTEAHQTRHLNNNRPGDDNQAPEQIQPRHQAVNTQESVNDIGTSGVNRTTTRNNQVHHHVDTINTANNDAGGPPSPWKSSKAKLRIIDELKSEASDIHLFIGTFTTSDFSNVNINEMHKRYAGKYKKSRFRENVKRILRHYLMKTGPFAPETVEPWYTSVKNVSKAYSMLYMLYMDSNKSRVISSMPIEQLWESHPEFQNYDLEKFKTYNTNMKALTSKKKKQITLEEATFHRDMLKLPTKTQTSRGVPFWHTHPASAMLKDHVTNEMAGDVNLMEPKYLWKLKEEYQAFPLAVFRKHIYQERTKQLAAPYWQHTRNEAAQKKYEEVQELLKEWNQVRVNKGVEDLVNQIQGLSTLQ